MYANLPPCAGVALVGGGDAPLVIGVDLAGASACVADAGDAALMVGAEPPHGGRGDGGSFKAKQRIVNASAVDISPQHGPARGVIFGDQLIAVIMVTRDEPALRGAFKQAAQRIIAQRCCAGCAGHCDKSVFDVIGIAVRAVAGQVAVGVVRKARRASGRILVQAVSGSRHG